MANSLLSVIGYGLGISGLVLGVLLIGIRVFRFMRWKPPERQEKSIFYFLLSYLIFSIIISLGVGQTRVQGESMLPELQDGQYVWMTRWHTGWQLPAHDFPFGRLGRTGHIPTFGYNGLQRTDIIVFRLEDRNYNLIEPQQHYIKRVVALPGDHYKIHQGKFYLNGIWQLEPYLKIDTNTSARPETIPPVPINPPDWYRDLGPFFVSAALNGIPSEGVVPGGGILVLGDNRSVSQDSRSFGFVPLALVEGRLILRGR